MKKGAKKSGRKPRPADGLAARLAELLGDDDATTQGQFDILLDALLELSSNTCVYISHPKVVAAFLLAAAETRGSTPRINELREIVALMEAGESFEDYRSDDGLRRWKARRKTKRSSVELQISHSLAEALRSSKTPADYRCMLRDALRIFSAATGEKYDEARSAETYLEACAALSLFHADGRIGEWKRGFDARLNILELLEGVKRKRPLDALDLREVAAPEQEPAGLSRDEIEDINRLVALKARLSQLTDITDEAERFRVEREIYDLEHPAQDPNDWGAWEEGGAR